MDCSMLLLYFSLLFFSHMGRATADLNDENRGIKFQNLGPPPEIPLDSAVNQVKDDMHPLTWNNGEELQPLSKWFQGQPNGNNFANPTWNNQQPGNPIWPNDPFIVPDTQSGNMGPYVNPGPGCNDCIYPEINVPQPPQGGVPLSEIYNQYPNQEWYNNQPQLVDYGSEPCEWMEQDPCDPQPIPYVPICDVKVCIQNCMEHFGYEEGACFGDECYCRKKKVEEKEIWTYEKPDRWPILFPDCAEDPDYQQSPIDINEENMRHITRKFKLDNYAANISLLVENNGYGLRLYVQSNEDDLPSLQVAIDLDIFSKNNSVKDVLKRGIYTLGAIDLHWGSSEHSIYGVKRDLEAQFYHFDLKYETLEQALNSEGGVVGLAILFTIDESRSDLDQGIFDKTLVEDVVNPSKVGSIAKPNKYFEFLDLNLSNWFGLYRGSLTYPPCFRNINWLVSNDTYYITKDQVEGLQKMKNLKGEPILSNFREIQEKIN